MLLRRHLASWIPLLAASQRGNGAEATPALVVAVDFRTSDASARLFVEPPEQKNKKQWMPPPIEDLMPVAINGKMTTVETFDRLGASALENAADEEVVKGTGTLIPFSVVPRDRRHVFHYKFEGLGQGRSLLLSEAWQRFGRTVTHYLLADPDWALSVAPQFANLPHSHFATALRMELTAEEARGKAIVAFKIFDRNGNSERYLDWFLRAAKGLSFKYRWHEALVLPEGTPYENSEVRTFTVTETEGEQDSYHREESGGSNTIAVSRTINQAVS